MFATAATIAMVKARTSIAPVHVLENFRFNLITG